MGRERLEYVRIRLREVKRRRMKVVGTFELRVLRSGVGVGEQV